MVLALERTSWRGLRVDHPADWEIALASGYGEPGRCAFADRSYHRLDIRWRKVKRPPNLELTLEKHRLDAKGETRELKPLPSAPAGWHGYVRKAPPGTIVHAIKLLRDQRMLVEATVVWPKRRDIGMESAILASVDVDASGDRRLWRAMGISLELSSKFDLRKSESKVGRVKWEFATDEKSGPQLSVERLAMPDYWLKGAPLRDWLDDDLAAQKEIIDRRLVTVGNHRGCSVTSLSKIGAVASLRGLHRLRLDLAWQCPVESRIYRISASQVSAERQMDMPGEPKVECCRHVGEVKRRRAAQ